MSREAYERKVMETSSTCFVEDYVNETCNIEDCCKLVLLWEYINSHRQFHEHNDLLKLAMEMKRKVSANVATISWMRDIAYYAQKKIANEYMAMYYVAVSKNKGYTHVNVPSDMPRCIKTEN